MRKRRLFLRVVALTCLIGVLLCNSEAGNRSGVVSGVFLKLPVNARAAGMGNAQVALAEGALSMAYNPAGTLSVEGASFGATYNQWYADITHSVFGVAVKLEDLGTFGAGLIVLSTDDMKVTTPQSPEGTGELFKATEFAYTVSYARQISELFGIGVSAKYISSNLFNKVISANSIAFDIGTLYDIPILRTRLGISVNNLGKDLKYINEQYSLPSSLRFGARTTVFQEEGHRLLGVFQITRPNDADEQYNLGAEYMFQDLIALRGGYKFNYDTEDWSGGLGVSLNSLGLAGTIDYAYNHYKLLPATHMFSLEIGF